VFSDRTLPWCSTANGDREPIQPAFGWELARIEQARLDPAAFAPLYEAYVDLVWRYSMSRLGDRDRAADATSQTFAKAIAALASYRPQRRGEETSFRAWLMTIARNVVLDEFRRERPAVSLDVPGIASELLDRGRSPEVAAIEAVERLRIERALTQLPDAQRKIVELRALGMTGAEIASTLQMSIGAVKTANHRAYQRLRELLREETEP
jgi:RNA polymerase sigma-70 factor (ECF subfamily)